MMATWKRQNMLSFQLLYTPNIPNQYKPFSKHILLLKRIPPLVISLTNRVRVAHPIQSVYMLLCATGGTRCNYIIVMSWKDMYAP